MNTVLKISCLFIGISASAVLLHASPHAEIRGLEAARAWLDWIDAEKYPESWEAAAPDFQAQIEQDEWIRLMRLHRQPLGQVEKRMLKRLFFTTELPDAPSGYYVVVQFETQFSEREESVLEILTPVLVVNQDVDQGESPSALPEGDWRVIGYYIK